jgi:hypothetical protein
VVDPVKCDVVIAVQKIGVVEMNKSIVKQRVAGLCQPVPEPAQYGDERCWKKEGESSVHARSA